MPILSIDGVPFAQLEDGPFIGQLKPLARQQLGRLARPPSISMGPTDTTVFSATRFTNYRVTEETFTVSLELRFRGESEREEPRVPRWD